MKFFLFIACFILSAAASAQTPVDSLRASDSLHHLDSLRADSLAQVPPPVRDTIRPILQAPFTSDSFLYRRRLFFSFTNPARYSISERQWQGKEVIFYAVIGLLLLFAVVKNNFQRYLSDLFGSYFRTTVRQRQIKEQLMQNSLPSLLFNAFFVLSGALFLSLFAGHFAPVEEVPFWILALYSAAALAVVYTGKFLLLKFFGWIFQLSEVTNTYIFVIFSTNKVLGILLLPFSILLAFGNGPLHAAAVTLSLVTIACLFAYRYFLSYISINHMLHINPFHFVLYLVSCEILPVLLINKLLFIFLKEIS